MSEILQKLNDIFCDVFDDANLTVGRETTAADVAGWDSLKHVTMILRVERVFDVRFTSSEVAMLQNVGELEDRIALRAKRST